MFENIVNLSAVAVIAAVFVVALVAVIQYSRYETHRKKHAADPKDSETFALANKFAIVPYLIVPIMFGMVSVFSSLIITDIAVGRGYVSGGEITVLAVAAAIVLYMVSDKLIVRHAGDAVYFDTIEDKLFQAAKESIVPDGKSGMITIPMEDYVKFLRERK